MSKMPTNKAQVVFLDQISEQLSKMNKTSSSKTESEIEVEYDPQAKRYTLTNRSPTKPSLQSSLQGIANSTSITKGKFNLTSWLLGGLLLFILYQASKKG